MADSMSVMWMAAMGLRKGGAKDSALFRNAESVKFA
jgi:hypothetical protein